MLAPVLGALTGRVDRRTLLVVSLLGFALGNALSALAPNLGLLLLARVATAAAAALYIPAASAGAAALSAPERRARAMAVVLGGLSAATVVGVPFGTWLAADLSWQATFWLLSGLGALCAAAVALGLPSVQLPPAPNLATRLAPVRDPRVAATVATTLLFMTGGYLALTYIGALLAPATDGNGSTLALLLLGFGVAAILGTTLAGRATDRWSPSPVLFVSVALLGLAVGTLPLTRTHLGTAAVALALWGFAGMATQPAQQYRLFGIAPQSGPLLISLNSAATFAGIAIGGFLGRSVLRSADTAAQGLDRLGLFGAGLIGVSLVVAVVATRLKAAAAVAAPAATATATD